MIWNMLVPSTAVLIGILRNFSYPPTVKCRRNSLSYAVTGSLRTPAHSYQFIVCSWPPLSPDTALAVVKRSGPRTGVAQGTIVSGRDITRTDVHSPLTGFLTVLITCFTTEDGSCFVSG
jgi:hypothetical protein